MKRKTLAVIALAALLFGCSNVPPKSDVGAGYDPIKYSFYSNESYETVFIRVLLQAEKCVPSIGLSRTRVTGETFEETRSATISIAQQGVAGTTTHMPIEITTENETTKIAVQNSLKRWDPYALAVKDWALYDSKACKATAN